MALPSNDINDLNRNSIIESTDVSGQPGIVVLNPDGTAVGAPVGGATASNQTDGSQKTQIVDSGGEAVTVTGGKLDVNATASLSGESIPISGATTAVGVAIVDGSGNQITSFGGGTQYTEGDTDASITGTAAMMEVAANTLQPVQGTVADGLLVNLGSNNDVTVTSGSITETNSTAILADTANMDTNLGTIAGAVSGTEMQVDVLSVVPGTGATNLGKAKDSTVSDGDTGVAVFGRLRYTPTHSSGSDGEYDTLDLTSWHELRTRDQRAIDIQNCNDYTDFTAFNSDTNNLADSLNHVFGSGAVSFDKVNGAANTVFGAITASVSNLNISDIFEDGSFVNMLLYVTSTADISYAFIRLGTDGSNYNEWRWDGTSLNSGEWNILRQPTAHPNSYAGNGWDSTDIQYLCVGVALNAETDTLSGIIVDHIGFVGGRVTDTQIDASISSSVNTPNINVHRMGGTPTDTNSGNKSAGTQRVVIATDDVNLASQTTSLAALDNAVDGNYLNVNANIAGTDMVSGSGTATGALRVELPTNGTGVIATVGAVTSITNAVTVNSHAVTNAGTFVVQENGAALTSLQLIDDVVYTDDTSTHSTGSTKGVGIMATATPTDTSVNANDIGMVAMTTDRRLLVDASGVAVPITDNSSSITVDYATTGSGTATGALRVELPTNGTGTVGLNAGTNAIGKLAANSGVDIGDVDVTSVIAGTGATNLGKAEDSGHTTGDTGVMMLGVRSASPTDRSAGPTDGDYEPFAVNEVGAIWVTETSSINGGDSTATASTADGSTALTNSAQVIKASAGKLTGYYIYNPNSSATYVNFYNTAAASVTVGTTNPLFNICIPATSAANLSGLKVAFSTAMSWSATTTGGGNTAPSTALEATCWYK